MFINTAPAPNRAAAPTAPVCTAGAAPPALFLLVAAAPLLPVGVTPVAVVLAETPLVNGTEPPLALLAPLNAGFAGAVLLGVTDTAVLFGLRTLSITWTTPLATSTSGIVTRAEFTKTAPSSMVMVTEPPFSVGIVVLESLEE